MRRYDEAEKQVLNRLSTLLNLRGRIEFGSINRVSREIFLVVQKRA